MSLSKINLKKQLPDKSNYFQELIDMARSTSEANALLTLINKENIFGWGTENECLLQYALGRWGPKAGVIVEIGSFKGRSTVCFAKGAKDGSREEVFAIDPHTGAPPWFPAIPSWFTLKEFESNLEKADVCANVTTCVTDSLQAARIWPALPVRVLFLDGDHSFEGLLADYEQWIEKLVVGGVLLIDDVDDPVHLPGIIRFVEAAITYEAFSNITIIDGILAAIKTDLGSMGHLYHLRECLKNEMDYTSLWDERSTRELHLENLQANNSSIAEDLINNNYQKLISSGTEVKLSTLERELLCNYCIYNHSHAVRVLTISQNTSESMAIFKEAIKFVQGGQVEEIKLSDDNWIDEIEQAAESWHSYPIRLLYLDLPDYNHLGRILNNWKIKLSKYAPVIVRKTSENQSSQIMHELHLTPFQGMDYQQSIYWAIWLSYSDEQILEFPKENAYLKVKISELQLESTRLETKNLEHQTENINLKAEITQRKEVDARLNSEIIAMKTSKFWKIREKWFLIKSLLRVD